VSFDIITNVASLQAQNYLSTNSAFQSKTINEVTSGLRIVQSGDDAAGLSIANADRSDEAVLTQGIQNANTGLSQLQIIDGGMDNISQLLDRARTLATESSTGTFTGDRSVLSNEFQSVLTEINRQSQAIGMNTGGTFAKDLTVLVGGGEGPTGAAAVANGSIALNLAQATVDAKSLGLTGVQSAGVTGTDIGTGSASSVANILADTANVTANTGYTTFNVSGPGFSGTSAVPLVVNLSAVTNADTLVTAVNAALTAAGNGATQAATALQNANITAAVNTDSSGRQQLTFTSSSTAFQVSAGDQMANALMGNLGAKAVMTGTTTAGFSSLATTDTLQLAFNGGPTMSFAMAGTETSAAAVATTLNTNLAFAANATASTSGGALVITSLNDSTGSTITVGNTNAATVLGLSGTATVNASTGKSLGETVNKSLGETVTATLGATGTTALTGTVVRIQGGGLASAVDLTLGTDTSQAAGVADLVAQVNANAALKTAGITAASTGVAGSKLTLTSDSGTSFNVSSAGDTTNELGFGSYLITGGVYNYHSITGANPIVTGVATDMLEISVAGGTAQQISVTGTAGDTVTGLVGLLNTALGLNSVTSAAGISATVAGASITLTSGSSTNFRVAEGQGTAGSQILGFGPIGGISNTLTASGDAGAIVTTNTTATTNATLAGAIVRFQGGGLASPVDLTLAAGDTTQALGLADLLNQVNTNGALQAVGITAASANNTLTFTSASGQSFNVSAVGDSTNELGLGNYLASGSAFNYTSITAANAIVTGALTDKLAISIAGGTAQQISVTGFAADTTQNLVDELNTALSNNAATKAAGITASVSGTKINLSAANGTAFRVAQGNGTAASQILGFAATTLANTLTAGAATGQTGDAGSFATVATSTTNKIQFNAGGSTATSVFQFSPILNAQDDQTISISGNDANGTAHSLAVVLSNNGSARNAGSLDQAIATINAALQASDDSTLQSIVAVKNTMTNSSGVDTGEGVSFLSTLSSFSVGLSAAGTNGTVGIGSSTQQGTVQVAATLAGGGTADISNQNSAESAVTAVGNATTALGSAQAVVGRGENEFTYAINLAQSELTNTTAAEASIRDADMAAEAANLTKAQILVQAGVAALAQANSAPQQVLTLLRGV
jgi:flagellin